MSEEKKPERVAMQHHQFTSNNLFTSGRAGLKRIVEAQWKGTFTDQNDKEITYYIEAEGTRTMNADDQDLFLHLLYLHRVNSVRSIEVGDKAELKSSGLAKLGRHITLNVSGYQLVKMLGWNNGGKSYKRLLTSLDRIGRVYLVCHYEDKVVKQQWSSHILYHNYQLNKQTKQQKIEITLCPLLALAAHRQGADLHSSHCLIERSGLSNDAKILHAAVCSKIRAGYRQPLSTDTLLRYLYGTKKVSRKAKCLAKKAIKELGTLPKWKITYQEDNDNWRIYRPHLFLDD